MQVLTPLFLRTLIDGVLPSKDGLAIAHVLLIIGVNELFLVLGNALLNRQLDVLENLKVQEIRDWMIHEMTKLSSKVKNAEAFYQSWSNESRRLANKKMKNPWYRIKDFIILLLLSVICLNISYLAGFLVLGISAITFILVTVYQTRQGSDFKQLHQLAPREKKLFDDVVTHDQSLQLKEAKIQALLEIGQEMNELQFNISKERTRYQDINNSIRFIMMFSILGVGGYLFATGKLSMGSLWALLITMYRITPPLQSLIRWILQAKSDENLEDRISENMKTKEGFQKPAYYNRLVKILDKAIKKPGKRIVVIDASIEEGTLLDSLELWRSFYSKKDQVEILDGWPEDTSEEKLFLLVTEPQEGLPPSSVIFTRKNTLASNDTSAEILNLN